MPNVSAILVIYNGRKYIEPVFGSIFNQTHKDLEVIAVINGNDDQCKELIQEKFPQVKIIDPGANLWFAKGNNVAIKQSTGEFVQLVNQDLILEPDYIERVLSAFSDSQVAAATGKLLRYDFEKNQKTNIIDTTGVVMQKSGRARDRGQNEIDVKQYDNQREVFAVSGAGPMYRRSALEAVQYCIPSTSSGTKICEYFDEDFVAYWEDVDLSWRLNRAGFKNVYVPEAIAFHGRTAPSSKGGYARVFEFIKHHRKLSPQVRKLNYKNHILMYLKNAPFIHPLFVAREFFMLGYIIIFETATLKVIPELLRQIKSMRAKRKGLAQH